MLLFALIHAIHVPGGTVLDLLLGVIIHIDLTIPKTSTNRVIATVGVTTIFVTVDFNVLACLGTIFILTTV